MKMNKNKTKYESEDKWSVKDKQCYRMKICKQSQHSEICKQS